MGGLLRWWRKPDRMSSPECLQHCHPLRATAEGRFVDDGAGKPVGINRFILVSFISTGLLSGPIWSTTPDEPTIWSGGMA